MSLELPLKPANRWVMGLILAATAVTGATVYYGVARFGPVGETAPPEVKEAAPVVRKVTALGRLEPQTEVINLSAPVALSTDRVAQLLVQQGDRVKAGQVIAILDSRDRLSVALEEAKQKVQVAQARLDQVKAGAKEGEIAAQQATIERLAAQWEGDKKAQEATIARLEAQLLGERKAQEATIARLQAEFKNAEAEYQRYQQLYQQGAESMSRLDSKRLTSATSREQLNEAKANLNRIESTGAGQLSEARTTLKRIEETGAKQLSEARATLNKIAQVRPVDVRAAQVEVGSAIAAVKRAQTELNQAYVRSPAAGQILKIHTRPGEKISDSGIADLGETAQMVAVAEVYQTDIGKIKLGQQAVVTSQAFPGELQGTVSEIGLQVSRQNVFSNTPGENLDRRVVEVKIRLTPEDSKRVAGLTN